MNARCDRPQMPDGEESFPREHTARAPGEPPYCVLYHVRHAISGQQAYVVGPTLDSVIRLCSRIFGALEGDTLSIAELAGAPGQAQLLVHESAVHPERHPEAAAQNTHRLLGGSRTGA